MGSFTMARDQEMLQEVATTAAATIITAVGAVSIAATAAVAAARAAAAACISFFTALPKQKWRESLKKPMQLR
jgi:hypothetical protein